jgi:predicted nucleic acid-binding protein
MAKANRKTYYWDSSAFIAWINGGKGHSKDVIEGLDAIAREVTENRAILCTSVITETELLQGKISSEQTDKLQDLFKRRNVVLISVDSKIARMASEIRNYYSQKNINIKSPDSIHLATAIMYAADECHTLDGDGERRRPSDLLRLNGNVAGHALHIRVPLAAQPSLFASIGDASLKIQPIREEIGKNFKEDNKPSASTIQRDITLHPESQAAKVKDESEGGVKT